MANKLKVEQLRAQLAQRGLDSTGNKPSLVQRLEEAIEKEESNQLASNKRGRKSDSGDNVDSKRIKAEDRFKGMRIKELRDEATRLGLDAIGTTKQLIQRLCQDADDKLHNNLQVLPAKLEMDGQEDNSVADTNKVQAALDQWLPDNVKTGYHVLQLGNDIYDAMLNQTNVRDNNNKFYLIQLLESHDGCSYLVYNRWGRVGIKGQDKIFGPYTSRDKAVNEFESKFLFKTKNNWCDRKNFICHPKCYTWLEMDYNEEEENEKAIVVKEKPVLAVGVQPRESMVNPRVAEFLSLICNVNMMAQQMIELGYNANKLPLGKLSKSTILKGYGVLKRISDVIDQSNRAMLEQLSGEFYTVIPHDFGFKKMRDFIIDTPRKLKCKLELVEALGEIELATKLLKEDPGLQDDPLYSHYHRLQCDLTPLKDDSEEFSLIAKYMQNTHAKTHYNYAVDIVHIFKVARKCEDERFSKFSTAKNRMLLWHGSRLTNWTGILSQGLRIAPPEAPVTGYMFGKGVYFADMFSKSANYCYASKSSRAGVLLLCEVALGEMEELLVANYEADKLPQGKLSTKGVGGTAPDLSEAQVLEDGTIVPLGKPKEQEGHKGSLMYNEYIVYNTDQIRMRYVVQVNFKFNPKC
ncbi:hypothetical protein ACFE04_016654 [Oxalis oulophora]